MPTINRPNLPYEGVARQNYNYFKLLTANRSGVPAESLDGYFNFFTDQVNNIYVTIAGINAGNLPGINDPSNAGKLLTTNGAGTQSWVLVHPNNILPNSITNDCIYPETITASELAIGGIGANQLAPDCVTQVKILDFNVTTNKIANGAVTEEKIGDEAITEEKIENGSVTTDKILDANITTDKILNSNVTTDKIANDAITTGKILNLNVTEEKIADGAVTLPKMAADVIKVSASKADQIAGISSNVYTSPLYQQDHPSAAKFWCSFDGATANGPVVPVSSYNVTSIVKIGSGEYILTVTIPFANSFWVPGFSVNSSASLVGVNMTTQTTNTISFRVRDNSATLFNSSNVCVFGYGLQ